jgi:diguanylate cyclase (GGDEF)-like protein
MLKYFTDNYVLLIMLIGMFIMTLHDVYLERDMIVKLRLTIVSIFALLVFSTLEIWFSHLDHPTIWRYLLSAICYSLRPMIIMLIVFIVYKKANKYIIIPAGINAILSFVSIVNGIVFSFDESNIFHRGILGYAPYFFSALYILGLLLVSVRIVSNNSFEESTIVFFMSFAAFGSALLALFSEESNNITDYTFGALVLIYYLYTYSQFTKRDTLTGLLNRQSYYHSIKKYGDSIFAVISIDMNELKWINDTMGHGAGDRAIKKVADCLKKCASVGDKVYRIGGDEFIVLCHKKSPENPSAIVDNMRLAVTESGYSCAFGLSYGKKVEELLKEADKLMYEDKARIKEEMKARGLEVHPRKD